MHVARPECSAGSVVQQLAAAPEGEVRARCSVSAPSPRDAGPLRFYWTYNGTKDVLPVGIIRYLICIIHIVLLYNCNWMILLKKVSVYKNLIDVTMLIYKPV